MANFIAALEEGNLFDMGWMGNKYTWNNRYGNASFTKERLDKMVANPRWAEIYKNMKVEVLATRSMDHKENCYIQTARYKWRVVLQLHLLDCTYNFSTINIF